MKGQRLFVRPVTSEDRARLAEFYRREDPVPAPPDLDGGGLIGFLVGEVAAHLSFEISSGEMEIAYIWVAKELRRKRVASVMLDEAGAIARKLGLARLAVRKEPPTDGPFLRLGFTPEGDRLVREIDGSPGRAR